MKRPVLITGGSGLLALNWAIAVRDRCRVTLGLHKRSIALAGVQSKHLDFDRKEIEIPGAGDDGRLVVHTAGLTNVDDCERDPKLAYAVNVELAAKVARACSRTGLKLVHISTDHLFAGDRELVDERQVPSPVNVYAKTKAEAEERVLAECPDALVVRTNFYGWGTSYRHSFSDFILDSLRNGDSPTLFTDVFYTPILIEDLALAVHELINKNAQGIFDVVGDDRISKYEFGYLLAQEFGLDTSGISPGLLAKQATDVKRPLDMSLSNRKACNFLGRKLGEIKKQIAKLHQQERSGVSQELMRL